MFSNCVNFLLPQKTCQVLKQAHNISTLESKSVAIQSQETTHTHTQSLWKVSRSRPRPQEAALCTYLYIDVIHSGIRLSIIQESAKIITLVLDVGARPASNVNFVIQSSSFFCVLARFGNRLLFTVMYNLYSNIYFKFNTYIWLT